MRRPAQHAPQPDQKQPGIRRHHHIGRGDRANVKMFALCADRAAGAGGLLRRSHAGLACFELKSADSGVRSLVPVRVSNYGV
ncbi:hypothetical protein GCM10010399_03700 [Dactylosporangium fulvum]